MEPQAPPSSPKLFAEQLYGASVAGTLELAQKRLLDLPARTFSAQVAHVATWGTPDDLDKREQAVKALLDAAIRGVLSEFDETVDSHRLKALAVANPRTTKALAVARAQLLDLPARIAEQVVQVAESPPFDASTRGDREDERAEQAVKTLLGAEIRGVVETIHDVITPGWRGEHDSRAIPHGGRTEPSSAT